MKARNVCAAAMLAGLVVPGLCLGEGGYEGQDEAGYAASTLDSRVSRLEKRLKGQPLTEMSRDIETLRAEIKRLRGTVEELREGLDRARREERDHYAALETRNAGLEARLVALTSPASLNQMPPPAPGMPGADPNAPADWATPPNPSTTSAPMTDSAMAPATQVPTPEVAFSEPTPAPPPPPPDPKIRQRDYERAFETLKAGKYTDAIADFQTFVAKYPSGEFSDSAQYWLGEAHYVNRDYVAARESFRKMLADFPQSGKVPDAELKLAYIEYEKEQYDKAKAMLNNLIKRYPESSAAKMAEKRLDRMTQERH